MKTFFKSLTEPPNCSTAFINLSFKTTVFSLNPVKLSYKVSKYPLNSLLLLFISFAFVANVVAASTISLSKSPDIKPAIFNYSIYTVYIDSFILFYTLMVLK